jgi:hypothetical protein
MFDFFVLLFFVLLLNFDETIVCSSVPGQESGSQADA